MDGSVLRLPFSSHSPLRRGLDGWRTPTKSRDKKLRTRPLLVNMALICHSEPQLSPPQNGAKKDTLVLVERSK